jgi:hypothetical protein
LWGPSAPTVKAIQLRSSLLKKLAREYDAANANGSERAGTPTAKGGGLITPQTTPKAASNKRSLPKDGKRMTPSPASKRRATRKVKDEDTDFDEDEEDSALNLEKVIDCESH